MKWRSAIPFLLLLLSPLSLDVWVSRSVVVSGDQITISAYLFNDGSAPLPATIAIDAPPGFLPLSPQTITGDIPPGGVLELHASYQVAAQPGPARFLIRGGGQTRALAIGVCCVEAPPAQFHTRLAVVRA